MTTHRPPGLHPLAWEYLCACVAVQTRSKYDTMASALATITASNAAYSAWCVDGYPLLDDEPPQADAEREQVVRWLRKVAKWHRKQPVMRSLDTDSIVSGESAAEALEDAADEIASGERAKEQS
jgi:hypothetical protein